MDSELPNVFSQLAVETKQNEVDLAVGEKRKYIEPESMKSQAVEDLKMFLNDWINSTLKREHIVVKNLEEDIFDGLVLHHLLVTLGKTKLDVQEVALSASSQKQKLHSVLTVINQELQLSEVEVKRKWDVDSIHRKDLLATFHLLIALAKHYQPDLAFPSDVCVNVITIENQKSGIKTEKTLEYLTISRDDKECKLTKDDVFDDLFKLAPDKVNTVIQAIIHFANSHLGHLGLQVKDIERQFADGVILLLLIGQLEGYFISLHEFHINPSSNAEMVHNVTLAFELLKEGGLMDNPVNPEDIVNKDIKTTLRVLYSLFTRHKVNQTVEG
ncbi:gamma-parvin isoform X1 [Protopterus annectens]|uniref:gamma-parvin isoform X1 n=1 Tax=Protopterus annectens TaxID=7888 RepID=UPI001CFA6155|nr:gamma-parvin isoform X1 [Protopterus annectens]